MTSNARQIKNNNGGSVYTLNGVLNSVDGSPWSNGYTVTDTDGIGIIEVGTLSGNSVITIPTAASTNKGRIITITNKNTAAYTLTINFPSTQFEWNGQTLNYSPILNIGDVLVIESNGTIWKVINYTGLGQDNYIINGDFNISQRGDFSSSSSATNAAYWVDRNKLLLSNTMNKQHYPSYDGAHLPVSLPAGISGVSTIKVTSPSNIGSGYIGVSQIIENPNGNNDNPLKQKVFTVSMWVKSNNANTRIRCSPDSGSSWTYSSSHTGSGNWELLSISVYFATAVGNITVQLITINANGTFPAITLNDYIETTLWMMNIGTLPASFILAGKIKTGELIMCQRYCYALKSEGGDNGVVAIGISNSGNTVGAFVNFPVAMRTQPSVVAAVASNWRVHDFAGAYTVTSFDNGTHAWSSRVIGYLGVNVSSGLTTFRTYALQKTAAGTTSSVYFEADI